MRQLRTRIMGTCAALLLGATLAPAQTDNARTTIVTFSAPVALPGVTLPAGSYMFKLADSQTNRNIVQVFDKDRTKIFATILAMPAQRNKAADETVITFSEAPANAAPAVQYWYYPGETRGQEFAYPKKQAISIANAAHTSVLAVDTDADNYDVARAGDISRVEPGAAMAQGTTAIQPTGAAAQPAPPTDVNAAAAAPQPAAQPATPPAPDMPAPRPEQPPVTEQPAPAPAQPSADTAAVGTSGDRASQPVGTSGSAAADMPEGHVAKGVLPRTASTLPLVGLAGLLALCAAAGVRVLRRATID